MKARFLAVVALAAALAAEGELNLAKFSPGNPIKIMPVGDSITDDCEVVGAWRRYFQQVADSNAVPFAFVGRQKTTGLPSFTKVYHEGYCGTVIAPPGVFAVHQYPEALAYLEKIVPDAFTNAKPDVILIMIGANDIGRGRNPYEVATNNMATLLDIIFSNLPNVNVILDKPTNLRNGDINGLLFGAYATNVPIYSAALQALVNQRRALGQNVFLGDMFSTVDYATMFLSDHVHPNATGMARVAREWFTRLQTILTGTNQMTASLIHSGDQWTYLDTGMDLGTNWSQPGFDDSGWSMGSGRFGSGELTDETIIQTNITTYFRKTFVVPWNEAFTNLNFRLAQTAGAVVWLNGREMYRTNVPSGPIGYNDPATTNLTGDAINIYYQTNIAGTNLLTGTNVVGVELHQSLGTNAALGFDLELLGGAFALAPPSLSATAGGGGNIILTWPTTNSGATFSLYSATNVAQADWQPANAALATNGRQITVLVAPGVGAGFYRLQRSP